MSTDKLILDSTALEEMGVKSEAIYLIEYDLHSEIKIPKSYTEQQRKEAKKHNRLAREFRNKLIHLLKFKLMATQHLESCWVIEETRLETAIKGLEDLKEQMKAKGFSNVDKRLRIIPILTTEEGFEHYEDKKAEYLLSFAMEHIKYLENGIKERRMSKSTLWRCKKAYELIEALKEELKGNKRYNEVVDTNQILGDLIGKMEAIITEESQKEA